MSAKQQIRVLADYIMAEIPGEPSRSEGAGDTAVRLLKQYRSELIDGTVAQIALKTMFDEPEATKADSA